MTLEADEKEIAKGDTLDLKAGILLALIAVLVTTNGTLLADPRLAKWLQVGQLCSLLMAALAAILASISFIPRRYDLPAFSSAYKAWIADKEHQGLPGTAAIEKMAIHEIWPRIKKNSRINTVRSRWPR